MKNLARGISTFREIIENNYLYIDKTKYIYNLYLTGDKYYFLSRPRRFGKSLLISTLKELFSGNKKLFKGLWIDKSDYFWQEFPVIHIDFSTIANENLQDFKTSLNVKIKVIAQDYGIDLNYTLLEDNITQLIKELSKKNKVVILIDEYDYPILKNINNVANAIKIRDSLQQFYACIKGSDEYLRAIFITGIARFSKTSIFSGLNNLNDISLKPEASALLGYTADEIKDNFLDRIEFLAQKNNLSLDLALVEIKKWYNGYQFSEENIKVFNPFSITYCFSDYKFNNFWFETGTPSFLISLFKKDYYDLIKIPTAELSSSSLGNFDINKIPLIALLFQTGYLTIESYNEESKKFILNFPNFEVEESFKKFLISAYSEKDLDEVETSVADLIKYLKEKDIDRFCKTIQILFAQIPYSLFIKKESYFHSLFQLLISLLSLESKSELLTNIGRIDLVLEIKKIIYIFELKLNTDPQVALDQIHQKKYYERFLNQKKEIILVGLSFKYKKNVFLVESKTEFYLNNLEV